MGQVEVFVNLAPWLTIQISLAGCENLTQKNSCAVEQLKTAVTEGQYYPSCSNYIPITQTDKACYKTYSWSIQSQSSAVHYNIFMGTQHLWNLINGYLGWNPHEGCSRYWSNIRPDTRSNVCQQELSYLICCLHKILKFQNAMNTCIVYFVSLTCYYIAVCLFLHNFLSNPQICCLIFFTLLVDSIPTLL